MYLGVDAWQSPNGFDILGIVIYRLVEHKDGDLTLESMPLDFIQLTKNHTGVYLAETVRIVVEKFGVLHKVSPSEYFFSLLLSNFLTFLTCNLSFPNRSVALSLTMRQTTPPWFLK